MDPAEKNDLVEIGRIGQARGLEGFLRIHPHSPFDYVLKEGALLLLKNRRGDLFPARIETVRNEVKSQQTLFFVKFDRIANRSEAETFRGTPVFSDEVADIPSSDSETVIDYLVTDETGHVGRIAEVMETPAHPILIIETEAVDGSKRILIPWVDAYVQSVDHPNQTVQCKQIESLKSL